jgi:hypothetical protein
MALYFGGGQQSRFGNDEADFGGSPAVYGAPSASSWGAAAPVVYGQPGPVVWGQPGPVVYGGQRPAWGGAFGQDYEILGAYEILGDPTASPAAKNMAAAVLQAKQLGGSAVLQQMPRREYKQVLPCTSLAIGAGLSRDISLTPQRPFRAEKFRASSTHTAPFFVITAYSIGQDNQFVGPGSIPVDLFSEVALYSQIEAYTANLGNLITLSVTNIDGNTRDFRAAFFGTSLAN